MFEFELKCPGGEKESVAFTAQAAFVERDSTPPFNEYSEARVEFPEAPIGETLDVKVLQLRRRQREEAADHTNRIGLIDPALAGRRRLDVGLTFETRDDGRYWSA